MWEYIKFHSFFPKSINSSVNLGCQDPLFATGLSMFSSPDHVQIIMEKVPIIDTSSPNLAPNILLKSHVFATPMMLPISK